MTDHDSDLVAYAKAESDLRASVAAFMAEPGVRQLESARAAMQAYEVAHHAWTKQHHARAGIGRMQERRK